MRQQEAEKIKNLRASAPPRLLLAGKSSGASTGILLLTRFPQQIQCIGNPQLFSH